MNKYNLAQGVGLGVVIWGVVALFVTTAVNLGILASIWTQLGIVVLAWVTAYFLSFSAEFDNMVNAFEYGLTFVLIGMALDLIVTLQVYPSLFTSWMYWVGYVAVLSAPLFQIEKSSKFSSHIPAH